MPVYEFKCTACRKKFSEKLTINQMEKKKPKCPKCGSNKTEKLISGFTAVTSKKS